MIQNKQRDDVRDDTSRASRLFGYALISLGLLTGTVLAVAPLLGRETTGPWFLSFLFMAVGIPLAFPRSAIGHAIIGRIDLILDKIFGKSDPNGGGT